MTMVRRFWSPSRSSSPTASGCARSSQPGPGTAARVSEPLLPLFLAALWHRAASGAGPLVCLLPEDADARDAAEAAGWFLGRRAGRAPRRRAASRYESGLAPPPHLVGERARALECSPRGGLVCASALGSAQGLPPAEARAGDDPRSRSATSRESTGWPSGSRSPATSGSSGSRSAASSPCAAASSTSSARPAASRSGSSSSATRSSRSARSRPSRSARSIRSRTRSSTRPPSAGCDLAGARAGRRPARGDVAGRPRAAARTAAISSGRPTRCARSGAEELGDEARARAGRRARPAPGRTAVRVRGAAAGRRRARASPRPRTTSAGFVSAGNRVVVAFAHRGEALRTKALLRKVDAELLEPGAALPRGARAARSPSSPGAARLRLARARHRRSSRTRRSSASARRARTRGSAGRSRASPTCAPATTSSTRTTASASSSASRRRPSPASRATTSSSRSGATTASTSRTSRSARSRATSAPTGRAPALSKLGGKAWQTLKARAREGARELAGELLALYAQRQRADGHRATTSTAISSRQLEASFPYEETPDQQRAIEAVKEDLEAPRPMDRLVCGDVGLRQDRGRRAGGVRSRSRTASRRSCSRRRPSSPSSTGTRSASATATCPCGSRWSRASAGPRRSRRCSREFAAGKVDVLIGTHRVLSRDVVPKDLGARGRRRGAALRRRAEGAPAPAAARGRRARAVGDADPAHAAHVARGPARHQRDRDAAAGPPPDPHARRRVRRGAASGSRSSASTSAEGQSFYLHNRVETIDERGREAAPALPGARASSSRTASCPSASSRSACSRSSRGDADVLVSTTIIESGLDIPQANTLDRRARRHARARPALPDPRARGAAATSSPTRTSSTPTRSELTAGGARAARDARRPHRARRGLRDRDARPRDPRRRATCSAPSSRGTSRPSASSSTSSCSARRSPSSAGSAGVGRPARPGRRARSTPTSRRPTSRAEAAKIDLHRRIALAESEDELRELRAATEDRFGPLPEPVENLFAIQEAKLKLARARRGLSRLPRRAGRRSGPLVLGSTELRELRRAAPTRPSTRAPGAR